MEPRPFGRGILLGTERGARWLGTLDGATTFRSWNRPAQPQLNSSTLPRRVASGTHYAYRARRRGGPDRRVAARYPSDTSRRTSAQAPRGARRRTSPLEPDRDSRVPVVCPTPP